MMAVHYTCNSGNENTLNTKQRDMANAQQKKRGDWDRNAENQKKTVKRRDTRTDDRQEQRGGRREIPPRRK